MEQKEQIDITKLLLFDVEKAKQGSKVVTRGGWVNIYKAVNTGHFFSDGNIYTSKEEAKDFCSNPFATIKIQWEENKEW